MTMNARKISLVIAVLFFGLFMLNGCKKSEPAPTETSMGTMHEHEGDDHAGHDHAEMAMSTKPADAVVAAVEQKTCPIMDGNPINTQYFTEYKGKKVYFCCPGCDKKFNANPEQYIAKLPQFNQ